ncbi:TetR/AcrR family transcriptional regulator [Pontibacter oryzae]|uniref:TetR/AcrR family transcriptional regulator n=1 Tax=Pontibacter oryzae TaxID=2304593 RepID=A0A399S691_9BACT|nr:TetR/AcrR family transcriptional regulator [Pontibacter oryzae]RIJ37582.1 TetR/AcrR family transcriptional regulator [Pontibacter oryzae]
MVVAETILSQLLQVFKSEGIECHTEEGLVQRLGIQESQYKGLFSSREDMVRQVILFDLRQQELRDEEMLKRTTNSVEEIMMLLQNGIEDLKKLNPAYIIDLQQYFPEVWQLCLEHLSSYNYYLNLNIINKGILQGYFRKDINLQLVVKIIMEQFHMMINPVIFPPDRYELGEVFRSVYLYYVRGICTEQGAKLAEEYFSKNNI